MNTSTTSTTIKTAVVTFADRAIKCGEFCGAFGFNKQIKDAVTSNIRTSSKMQVEVLSTSLIITYTGKLAKSTLDDLYRLAEIGIIEVVC